MDKDVLDLYTDYLMSLFGQTTATGLSTLLDGTLSHDRISRFLAAEEFNSVTLWQFVKPLVRQVQQEDAVVHSLGRLLLAVFRREEFVGETPDDLFSLVA